MKSNKSLPNYLKNFLKVAFSFGLLLWIYQTGRLDPSKIGLLLTHPALMAGALALWVVGPCWLGTLRWRTLLHCGGFHIGFFKAIQLQLTGFFFNATMPGAIGGDLMKVYYVIRENQNHSKSNVFMTVILDRVLGLIGLFSIGLLATILFFPTVYHHPVLLTYSTFVSGIVGAMVVAFWLLLRPKAPGKVWLESLLKREWPGISLLSKLYHSSQTYMGNMETLRRVWLISLLIQIISFLFFGYIARLILHDSVSWEDLAIIFPLGIFLTALPISPGGLGVGHMAFEKLFSSLGYSGGANIFNIFFISQFVLNLFGIIPYLMMRKGASLDQISLEDPLVDAKT